MVQPLRTGRLSPPPNIAPPQGAVDDALVQLPLTPSKSMLRGSFECHHRQGDEQSPESSGTELELDLSSAPSPPEPSVTQAPDTKLLRRDLSGVVTVVNSALEIIVELGNSRIIAETVLPAYPTAPTVLSFPFASITIPSFASGTPVIIPPDINTSALPPESESSQPSSSPSAASPASSGAAQASESSSLSASLSPSSTPPPPPPSSSSSSSSPLSETSTQAQSSETTNTGPSPTSSPSSTGTFPSVFTSSPTRTSRGPSSSSYSSSSSSSSSSSETTQTASSSTSSSTTKSSLSSFTSSTRSSSTTGSRSSAATSSSAAAFATGGGAGGGSPTGALPSNSPSSTAAAAAGSTSGGVNVPVVGGVVGGLAGLAVLLGLILILLRWRRRKMVGANNLRSVDDSESAPPGTAGSGAGMVQHASAPWGAAIAPIFRKKRPQSTQTTATATTSTSPSERGFQKLGGRKIESVLTSGGDGYGDKSAAATGAGAAGAAAGAESLESGSYYRDSKGTYGGPGAGPGSTSAHSSMAVGPGSTRRSDAPSSSADYADLGIGTSSSAAAGPARVGSGQSDEIVMVRPGAARTVIHSPGFGTPSPPPIVGPPGATAYARAGTPPGQRIRPRDPLGRSHPSFDGSRGSRGSKFAEDLS